MNSMLVIFIGILLFMAGFFLKKQKGKYDLTYIWFGLVIIGIGLYQMYG